MKDTRTLFDYELTKEFWLKNHKNLHYKKCAFCNILLLTVKLFKLRNLRKVI